MYAPPPKGQHSFRASYLHSNPNNDRINISKETERNDRKKRASGAETPARDRAEDLFNWTEALDTMFSLGRRVNKLTSGAF